MQSAVEHFIKTTLKPTLRNDLEQTRIEYNSLSKVLFLGVGLTALLALLLLPGSEYKFVVYVFTAYSLLSGAYNKWNPPGYSLATAVAQVPLGLAMIISLQWLMPVDQVYVTALMYPIVFVFIFEFHVPWFVRLSFLAAIVSTGLIVWARELPYWDVYLVTTFGATLIIGSVVSKAAEKNLLLANHDALTGLLNRRHWEERLNYLLNLSGREQMPLTLAYIDLDHFKQINDEQGHAAGDALLKQVSNQLGVICRDTDLVARWGGDEFAIAMPNTTEEEAGNLIQRLEMSLQDSTRFSTGIVTAELGESMDGLLHRADQAMYAIKAAHKSLETY